MITHKNVIFCFTLFFGASVLAFHEHLESHFEQMDAKRERAERIGEAFAKALQSDEAKERAQEIKKSLEAYVVGTVQAAMNEIDPEDAKALLPMLDNMDLLFEQAFELSKNKSLPEMMAIMSQFIADIKPLMAFSEFTPAIKKCESMLNDEAAKNNNYSKELALETQKSCRAISEIVRQKALGEQ